MAWKSSEERQLEGDSIGRLLGHFCKSTQSYTSVYLDKLHIVRSINRYTACSENKYLQTLIRIDIFSEKRMASREGKNRNSSRVFRSYCAQARLHAFFCARGISDCAHLVYIGRTSHTTCRVAPKAPGTFNYLIHRQQEQALICLAGLSPFAR